MLEMVPFVPQSSADPPPGQHIPAIAGRAMTVRVRRLNHRALRKKLHLLGIRIFVNYYSILLPEKSRPNITKQVGLEGEKEGRLPSGFSLNSGIPPFQRT
jgi:hypothetical protein